MFDMATWHTATANTSDEDRRVCILRCAPPAGLLCATDAKLGAMCTGSSSLVAQSPLLPAETEQRLRESGRMDDTLARLVGAREQ